LTEATAKAAKLKETIERGHGWMKRAKLAEEKASMYENKYKYASECIQEAKARYFSDISELGRRVLQLEFKISDEEVLKELNEATTPKALVAIRERLEGKTEKSNLSGKNDAKGEPKTGKEKDTLKDKKDDKDEAGKQQESTASRLAGVAPVEAAGAVKEAKKEEPKAEIITEAKVNPRGLPALVESVGLSGPRSFSINEQAECVGRLSRANAAAQK
jgi:hypothetical protein